MTLVDTPSFKKILARNVILPIALSVVLLAIMLVVVFSILDANKKVSLQSTLIEKEAEAYRLIVDAETGIRGLIITRDDDFLGPYLRSQPLVLPALQELQTLTAESNAQASKVSEIKRHFEEWDQSAQGTITKIQNNRKAPTNIEQVEKRRAHVRQIRAAFEDLERSSARTREELISSSETTARLALAFTVFFTLSAGGALAIVGRKQLLTLSSSYEESLSTQVKHAETLSRQAWIRTGQAKVAEKIRGETRAEQMGELILGHLAEYTGAVLGAAYFLSKPKEVERVAHYAFAETAGSPKRFSFGSGLVGQVAESQTSMILNDLPDDYVQVVSGTGQTKPRHLVLVPLTAEGSPQGVLEFGFLAKPDSKVIELLEESAEIIGMAVRARAHQERLQQLLHESQQLTEELQTQQEELRVSNEELEERTRVLQETQARLESQHAELEQTNEQLEEQASMLEEQKRSLDTQNNTLLEIKGELEQKAKEIEAASRYKSEFLANMSHELRTPLNSSLILAKLLKDNSQGNLTNEQVEFASTIYSAGNDLLLLINDILDLSKVEAGKLEINPENVNLSQLATQMERSFRPITQEKGLDLRINLEKGLPETIYSDGKRVEQILKNLISNAVKFTSQGFVELSLKKREQGRIEIAVKDTGIGIDPSHHKDIFEAFRQADGTTSRKFGGTGLGLSISKTLASLLGGEILLESGKGKGSTFTLVLPEKLDVQQAAKPASVPSQYMEAPAKPQAPKKNGNGKTAQRPAAKSNLADDRASVKKGQEKLLLLIEDEPRYAKILMDTAHELGFKCLHSMNIEEGFQLAKEFAPTALLLDIRLPDGSGLSLLDRLKRDPETRHIPVHGMSVADYSREALHLGAAAFGVKPSDVEEIKKTLQKIEEKARSQTKHVLLVEDDQVQRTSVTRLISAKGVKITAVESGGEALQKLKEKTFDCMIIDLKLPDMSGFELLEKMSKQSGSSYPPVIVYTGRQLSNAEEETLYRYSKSIIIKGARSPERLLDEVTLFLHQPEVDLPEESQRLLKVSRNRERAFEGRTILVVDDDVRNIFAMTNAVEMKGAKAIIARNGKEALEKIDKHPEIDLVLMDIMMPEMDGLEATRRIRSSSSQREVPVIAVTAKAMQDDYEKCLEAGANDYLAKPVDLDKLMSLIRVWLPKHLVIV